LFLRERIHVGRVRHRICYFAIDRIGLLARYGQTVAGKQESGKDKEEGTRAPVLKDTNAQGEAKTSETREARGSEKGAVRARLLMTIAPRC